MKLIETSYDRQMKENILDVMEEVIGAPRELWEYRRSRRSDEVKIRHIYIYFLRKYGNYTLKTIADFVGHSNHTTIIHSLKIVNDWLDVPHMYQKEISILKQIEKIYGKKYENSVDALA